MSRRQELLVIACDLRRELLHQRAAMREVSTEPSELVDWLDYRLDMVGHSIRMLTPRIDAQRKVS